jgi:hypothetical protein
LLSWLGLPSGFWLPSAVRLGSTLEPQWATTGLGREPQFYDPNVLSAKSANVGWQNTLTGDRGSVLAHRIACSKILGRSQSGVKSPRFVDVGSTLIAYLWTYGGVQLHGVVVALKVPANGIVFDPLR